MASEASYYRVQPGINPGIVPGMIPTNGAPPVASGYGTSIQGYAGHPPEFVGPPPGYVAPSQGYAAPPPGYGAPGPGAPPPQMDTLMQGFDIPPGLERLLQVYESPIFCLVSHAESIKVKL